MGIGQLNATGALAWIAIVAVTGLLVLRGRTQALRHAGRRAFKERRVALLVYAVTLVSLLVTVVFVGDGDGTLAGEGVIPGQGPPDTWRGVALALMLANATGAMVACALIVLGMLRDTSTGRVLFADAMMATAGLVSLWGVASNFPSVG
jgi:hypothetical protein